MTATMYDRPGRGQIWQTLNVIFAFSQVLIGFVGNVNGTNDRFTTTNAMTPQVVPALYVFFVWPLIYLGCIAYAVYQALPRNRENELLRRIGPYTASAFLGSTVWVVAAQSGWGWLTVTCIFWMLVSLIGAFIQFIEMRTPFAVTEHVFVVLPISIYTGWITVASVANTASILKASGFSTIGLSDQNWSILMLLIGGLIAAFVTLRSRGNVGYALTVIWALIGVVVANVVRTPSIPVAVVAGSMAVLVTFALLRTRLFERLSVA